jgi:hypothetical protein
LRGCSLAKANARRSQEVRTSLRELPCVGGGWDRKPSRYSSND